MMSRITSSQPQRAVKLAGLLAFASLALASAAHAQTIPAERALLNKTDAPFGVSKTNATPVTDGGRALLGQPSASAPQVFPVAGSSRLSLGGPYGIDGERALLGRSFGHKAPHVNSALRN